MQNNQVFNWGIIGCGNVTEVKSGPAYQQVAGFKLKAVMRRNEALARDYANRHGVAIYCSDADVLINDPAIDAVYIATPPDSHKHYALKVAQAGKICCIEKPLAPNLADSLAIKEAFEKARLPLFVAYYRRSLPRFIKVKTLLEQNAIGDIRHIHWTLSKPASQTDLSSTPNWRTDSQVAPGGYFDDLASHGLDLFAFLLGEFRQVKGISGNQQNLYSASDAISACWQHVSGVTGSGLWNFGSWNHQDKVTITGSRGEISFAIFADRAIELSTGQGIKAFMIDNPMHVQFNHVENIYRHLTGQNLHPSTAETAVHTAWVMDSILNDV